MLFLFNDAIFDLGDARTFALEHKRAEPVGPSALMTTCAVRRVMSADGPQLARTSPDKAAFLGALLAWKTDDANALLAVAPRHITLASQVEVRLASVSLVTLQQLRDLQDAGRLSSHTVNLSVWSHAPQRMRA